VLTPLQAAQRLCFAPSVILGTGAGRLGVDAPADLILVDPSPRWTFSAARLVSAGRNTPFDGIEFRGRLVRTWRQGQPVFDAGV